VAVRPRPSRGVGQHFLRSSKLAAELVRAAQIQRDDMVLDLGAGTGILTAALACSARRVVAVEIDPRLASQLRERFAGVEVVEGDALRVALPPGPFKVVANLPFDGATAILRRLLDPRHSLESADVIVQWEAACRRAAVWPTTKLGTYWGAWFELSVARRLPRCAFAPPPTVDGGLLRIVRRGEALVPAARHRAYQSFLARGYRAGVRSVVSWRQLKRWEAELGLDRHAEARDLDARQWAELFLRSVRTTG
jgi:23S rRNA (adenine-N6)-dimethyltransferase